MTRIALYIKQGWLRNQVELNWKDILACQIANQRRQEQHLERVANRRGRPVQTGCVLVRYMFDPRRISRQERRSITEDPDPPDKRHILCETAERIPHLQVIRPAVAKEIERVHLRLSTNPVYSPNCFTSFRRWNLSIWLLRLRHQQTAQVPRQDVSLGCSCNEKSLAITEREARSVQI
mgnify:CR=1 FL=1